MKLSQLIVLGKTKVVQGKKRVHIGTCDSPMTNSYLVIRTQSVEEGDGAGYCFCHVLLLNAVWNYFSLKKF